MHLRQTRKNNHPQEAAKVMLPQALWVNIVVKSHSKSAFLLKLRPHCITNPAITNSCLKQFQTLFKQKHDNAYQHKISKHVPSGAATC
jgi:hypothetical protein